VDRSYKKPLINLKLGPKEKEITFVVDSGAARSSLIMTLPQPAGLSSGRLPISGVKEEEFLQMHTDEIPRPGGIVNLLFVPEVGISLLERDNV
jgi:hypothetical protein